MRMLPLDVLMEYYYPNRSILVLDRPRSDRQMTDTGIQMHSIVVRVGIQGADCNTAECWALARTEMHWFGCSKAEAVRQVAGCTANQEVVEGTAVLKQAGGQWTLMYRAVEDTAMHQGVVSIQ